MPPETALVPPTVAAFSYTSTDAPLTAAVSAAVRPAAPLPNTTTSVSRSQLDVVPIAPGEVIGAVPSSQLRISDNCSAAFITVSLPRMTTSSRWLMRLMQVGGEGARLRTGTARP